MLLYCASLGGLDLREDKHRTYLIVLILTSLLVVTIMVTTVSRLYT